MSEQIAKYLSFLEYLCSTSSEERTEQLQSLKSTELKFFLNLLYNVVYKRVPISKNTRLQLKPHKDLIQSLIQPKKSLKLRKVKLSNGDNFKTVFDILLPDLREIVLP